MDRENEIRVIAYRIWEEEGCPEGKDCEYWSRAEIIWEENNQEKAGSTAAVKKSAKKTVKAASKKTAKK